MKVNRLDKFVSDLYLSLGITKIEDLTIENLSRTFGVKIYYYDLDSFLFRGNKGNCIVIDSRKEEHQQRSDFFHELAHYILDHYTSSNKLMSIYCEGKADTLMGYLAIPLHLIETSEVDFDDPNYIQKMSAEFGMEFDLTFQRLNKLRNLGS